MWAFTRFGLSKFVAMSSAAENSGPTGCDEFLVRNCVR